MRTSNIYFTVLLALSMAACTNDDLQDNPLADGSVALNVTGGINQPATRASGTAFEDNDKIGIFPMKGGSMETAQANKLYTYSSGEFGSDNPYFFQDRNEVTFFAYYPYDASLTADSHTIDIDTRTDNQTNRTDISWRKNDYLSASDATTVSNPSVAYTGDNAFTHTMSQVIFNFKTGDGIADLTALTGYKIATALTMDGTFDPTTGNVTPDGTAEKEALAMTVTDASGSEYTCTPLILVPQYITGTLDLEVTYNGETYTAALTAPTGGSLQAGNSYTYNVTVSNTGLEVGDAIISDWTPQSPIGGDATLQ